MAGKKYTGPVCYVGQPGTHDINGAECEPGWHYSVVVDEDARKLALDHAQGEVDLWERRAGKKGIGRFLQAKLDGARASLQSIQDTPFHVPGEKLYLDETTGEYRVATDSDKSWFERHHQRYNLIAPGGNLGDPHDADAVEATMEHLDRLEKRLAESGIDDHEADHIYRTPDQIAHARAWLSNHPARSVTPARRRLRSVE